MMKRFDSKSNINKNGFTLFEVVITMIVIAVVVSVCIGITRKKVESVFKYTYYNAYSTISTLTTEILRNYSNAEDACYGETQCSDEDLLTFKTPLYSYFYPAVFAEEPEEPAATVSHMPLNGYNLCMKIAAKSNTIDEDDECSGSSITSGTTDFADETPDIILRNGIKIYNLSQNPSSISALEYPGSVNDLTLSDGTTLVTALYGYTIYVDINGTSGNSELWEDVFPIYITLSGLVVPAYPSDGEKIAGNSSEHLQVSVADIQPGRVKWITKSKSFREAACISGRIDESAAYCKLSDTDKYTKASDCNTADSNCTLKFISPIKFVM